MKFSLSCFLIYEQRKKEKAVLDWALQDFFYIFLKLIDPVLVEDGEDLDDVGGVHAANEAEQTKPEQYKFEVPLKTLHLSIRKYDFNISIQGSKLYFNNHFIFKLCLLLSEKY